jgi:NAD(P)-dependent dehydrogenase (short-subunit alcohol dehydrogenase family)
MSEYQSQKIALVTGANKGIGLEIGRQLAKQNITVLLGARDEQKGTEAATNLSHEGLDARFVKLDVTDEATIKEAAKFIEEQFGKLDILVNNAGVNLEYGAGVPTPSQVSLDTLKRTFETNFFGAVAATQLLLPLIRKSEAGRIVNISSNLASLTLHSNPSFDWYDVKQLAYDSSKTALNAFTVHLAHELKDTKIKVNSAHPGWVKTDMGTDAALLTAQEGAQTPVWLALLPDDGSTGGFFFKEQSLPW